VISVFATGIDTAVHCVGMRCSAVICWGRCLAVLSGA